MLTDTTHSPYAKASPLPLNTVTWTKGFWKDAVDSNARHTLPHLQAMFESPKISHVVENFRICSGESEGSFDGTEFGDGDFYKWMEAAVLTAGQTKDKKLLQKLEEYIDLIARTQQEDGYISTQQIIGEREQNGVTRFGSINDFEVYNFGHLLTAACMHKRITGKDTFLHIAKKAAGCLARMYEESANTGHVQTAVCPSHYMGLIELYRTTGEKKYLDLAQLAITLRDSVTEGSDDNQDRIPLRKHTKILGHAVRANYLYGGVADLYAETGDEELFMVLSRVWQNLMNTKLYITGGCGALYNGASPYGNFFDHQLVHQAYGYEYQLPNITAYNETCASIGHVLWAHRMFQIEPRAEYFDAIERAMVNVNLAAVSLDGKKFFYENALRRAKKLEYELIWPSTRSEYILSYCCPPNLARTVAESGEYAYCCSKGTLWLGLYGSNTAEVSLPGGARFTITQTTDYPYDGEIVLHLQRANAIPFQVNVRIPHWAKSGLIEGEGMIHHITGKDSGTYYSLPVTREGNACIRLTLDMPVRFTVSHNMVEENTGQAAIERGPLVYCVESPDAEVPSLSELMLDLNAEFSLSSMIIEGRRVTALQTRMYRVCYDGYNPDSLYQELPRHRLTHTDVRLIPYFAWDNRGNGEMKVWLPIAWQRSLDCSVIHALPLPDRVAVEQRLLESFQGFSQKIVVLDDDPTGTQTVHDVPVYTDWSEETLAEGLSHDSSMFFVLTNSRSFSRERTIEVHREIGKNLALASQKTGREFLLISRGDSTLRGHFPLETAVLKETLEAHELPAFDGEIICPFFPEGGRFTMDNIHYVLEDGRLIPAGMTEFAADKSFGYKASHLGEYLEEKSHGAYKAKDCIYIGLTELRGLQYQQITEKLLSASDFAKIIVNALDYVDLSIFMTCWLTAMKSGKHYMARSAASLTRVAGNISAAPLLTKEDLLKEPVTAGGLIMVGSHVQKTTRQLESLLASSGEFCALEFLIEDYRKEALENESARILSVTETQLLAGKTVIVFTPRRLLVPKDGKGEDALALSVSISDAFTEIVRRLTVRPRFLMAKGGITSSDIATKGLDLKKAMVMGQIQKGIPVWLTGEQSKFPHMPYIIFPGNVGDENTLRDIVHTLL